MLKNLCFFFFHVDENYQTGLSKPRRKLNWDLMRSRDHQRLGDLGRGWKRIGRHATSAQFVTESWSICFGVMLGEQRNCVFGPIGRRFPANRQGVSDRPDFSQL